MLWQSLNGLQSWKDYMESEESKMIASKNGKVKIKGDTDIVFADFGVIVIALIGALSAMYGEKEAKEKVQSIFVYALNEEE